VIDVMLAVAMVAAVYSLMSGKPKLRRSIAQRIAVLAMSGVLLSESHTRSGWSHWMNLGIGVFGISCVVFQVEWDRRHKPRGGREWWPHRYWRRFLRSELDDGDMGISSEGSGWPSGLLR
jgi:hypothetical protein